jgi:hypothetical protein
MDNDPSRHPQQVPADDHDDDVSVRGYLRQLRWIAPGLLVCCLAVWALGKPRRVSLPWALFLWAILTVAVGPLIWLRHSVRRGTSRWWRAFGLAVVWWLGALVLFGIVMAVLNGG